MQGKLRRASTLHGRRTGADRKGADTVGRQHVSVEHRWAVARWPVGAGGPPPSRFYLSAGPGGMPSPRRGVCSPLECHGAAGAANASSRSLQIQQAGQLAAREAEHQHSAHQSVLPGEPRASSTSNSYLSKLMCRNGRGRQLGQVLSVPSPSPLGQPVAMAQNGAGASPRSQHSNGSQSVDASGPKGALFPHVSAPAVPITNMQPSPSVVPGPPPQPALVVFSGGTAFNSVAGALRNLTTRVVHVLPVSDDGGSTAEVVRVLGGPAVGDIRSRCLRLADDSDSEALAVKELLAHRLPARDAAAARMEWYAIVEGDHQLWDGVSQPYKHVIRAYLLHFHYQILGHASEKFNFCNGSVGNFFFAGARTFFRSLEAAIFLFTRVARIPEGCTVLPAICTEERITLGAELEDGTVIRGQNNISHPPVPAVGSDPTSTAPGHVVVVKASQQALPSPIRRVYYLSTSSHAYPAADPCATPGGAEREHEVLPAAHPAALTELGRCDAVVYGMGSLYTSICPTICLGGMGEAVSGRCVHKILMLNGTHDRETSRCRSHPGPMTACDVVKAICDALNRAHNRQGSKLSHPPSAYVTSLLVPQGGQIHVDVEALAALGVHHVLEVQSHVDGGGQVTYDAQDLVDKVATVLRLPLPESESSLVAVAVGSA